MNAPHPIATLNTSVDTPIGEAMTHDAAYILTGEALRAVIAERMEQVQVHGHTLARDALYQPFDLVLAAKAYADAAIDQLTGLTAVSDDDLPKADPDIWPWHPNSWKPGTPRANLVKAGALIWAAIDRLDHAPVETDADIAAAVDRFLADSDGDHPGVTPLPPQTFEQMMDGVAGIASPMVRTCRSCGCTDQRACMDGGEPCCWVDTDLCSACAPCAVADDRLHSKPPTEIAMTHKDIDAKVAAFNQDRASLEQQINDAPGDDIVAKVQRFAPGWTHRVDEAGKVVLTAYDPNATL